MGKWKKYKLIRFSWLAAKISKSDPVRQGRFFVSWNSLVDQTKDHAYSPDDDRDDTEGDLDDDECLIHLVDIFFGIGFCSQEVFHYESVGEDESQDELARCRS